MCNKRPDTRRPEPANFCKEGVVSEIEIGVIGEFEPGFLPHRATNKALGHSGAEFEAEIRVTWLPTDTLEQGGEGALEGFDGLWCAPGSPYRSLEGALGAVRFAREGDIPFIGTCGGFQHAVLEYARNVVGFKDAHHAEYDPYASNLFISALECSLAGKKMGVEIQSDCRAFELYGRGEVEEEYYCNFGLNPDHQADLERCGLAITGSEQDGEARIVELPTHRFFLATLFVPQTSSTLDNPHPLVSGFVKAARVFSAERRAGVSTGVRRPG